MLTLRLVQLCIAQQIKCEEQDILAIRNRDLHPVIWAFIYTPRTGFACHLKHPIIVLIFQCIFIIANGCLQILMKSLQCVNGHNKIRQVYETSYCNVFIQRIVTRYNGLIKTHNCIMHKYFQWLIIKSMGSAWFTYRLGRLKPRASTSKGPLAKVYNIFVIVSVIDLSYTSCHKPSVMFLALHFRIIRLISRP